MVDLVLGDGTGAVIGTGDGGVILAGQLDVPYDRDDFADAAMAHLPEGIVWPRELDAVLRQVTGAAGPTYERMTVRAVGLLADAPVGTLDERLPDWEATLGLPDPCAGPAPTLDARRQSVAAAIAARGGQSVPYFVHLAALLGVAITVEEFMPAQAEVSCADDPCCEPGWAHVWWAGMADYDARVECTLRRFAPAHTRLEFVIQRGPREATWDTGVWDVDTWGVPGVAK